MISPDEWLIRDYERTVGNLRRDLTAAQLKASVLLGAAKRVRARCQGLRASLDAGDALDELNEAIVAAEASVEALSQ